MKDFKKLEIWQLGMDIVDRVFDLYDGQSYQAVAEYKSQSCRAAVSIPSNIAEGCSRRSEKEKLRYMEIALGSAFELETQTLSAMRRSWCPSEKARLVVDAVCKEQKMLMSFMTKLNP